MLDWSQNALSCCQGSIPTPRSHFPTRATPLAAWQRRRLAASVRSSAELTPTLQPAAMSGNGPAAKKARLEAEKAKRAAAEGAKVAAMAPITSNVIIQFQSATGEQTGEAACMVHTHSLQPARVSSPHWCNNCPADVSMLAPGCMAQQASILERGCCNSTCQRPFYHLCLNAGSQLHMPTLRYILFPHLPRLPCLPATLCAGSQLDVPTLTKVLLHFSPSLPFPCAGSQLDLPYTKLVLTPSLPSLLPCRPMFRVTAGRAFV